jgi:hypothetical protein
MATYDADTYTRIGYNSIPDNGRIGYGSFDVIFDIDAFLEQTGNTNLIATDVVNLCRLPVNSAVQRVVTTVARPLEFFPTNGTLGDGEKLVSVKFTPKVGGTDAAGEQTVILANNVKGYVAWGGAKDLKSTSNLNNTLSVTIGAITSSVGGNNGLTGGKLIFSVLTQYVLDPDEVYHLNPDEVNATTGGV